MAGLKLPITTRIYFERNKQQQKSSVDASKWFQVSQELDAIHFSEMQRKPRDVQFLTCLLYSMCKKELLNTEDKRFTEINQDTSAFSWKALWLASLFGSFSGDHKSKDSE